MSILVTGGAGFIGSHLVERLLSSGQRVICLDNFNDYYDPQIKSMNIKESSKSRDFALFRGDIRDLGLVETIFEQDRIEKVVHLAACVGVRYSLKRPLLYTEVNVQGTANLLEMSRKYGVDNFIFASSSSVYGNSKKVPFSEEDRADRPVSPYAATKKAGELLCTTYHHLYGLNVNCLRFFTAYGPRQRPEMAIHRFTHLIEQGKEIPVFGDGTSRRDYTHITDIIQGVMSALDKKCGFEIFNLGHSETVELNSLVRLLEENLNKKARIKNLPPQPGDVDVTYADVSKAERMLGYKTETGIEEGVRLFVKWFREHKGHTTQALRQ